MSIDLINRQEVLNFIQGIKDEIIENKCFGDNTRTINMGDLNDILIFIRNMQTAFDIDKLKKVLSQEYGCTNCKYEGVCKRCISTNCSAKEDLEDIFYLIDETLNELKDGVKND